MTKATCAPDAMPEGPDVREMVHLVCAPVAGAVGAATIETASTSLPDEEAKRRAASRFAGKADRASRADADDEGSHTSCGRDAETWRMMLRDERVREQRGGGKRLNNGVRAATKRTWWVDAGGSIARRGMKHRTHASSMAPRERLARSVVRGRTRMRCGRLRARAKNVQARVSGCESLCAERDFACKGGQ